jgi:hypothetical protein
MYTTGERRRAERLCRIEGEESEEGEWEEKWRGIVGWSRALSACQLGVHRMLPKETMDAIGSMDDLH